MWQGWINLLVSVWLITGAYFETIQNEISMLLASIILIISGIWGAGKGNSWQDMSIGFIGFILLLLVSVNLVNGVAFFITGVVAFIISLWDLFSHPHPTQNS